MIHYRKVLELHDEGISLRGIASSTGHSRQKVTEIIGLAEKKGLVCPLEEEMTDKWIEEFLFPEKTLEASGLSIALGKSRLSGLLSHQVRIIEPLNALHRANISIMY
ncbi:hypothetical protein [Bacillus sp. es.034]|uniref:hypothetical protein n=1 Tax=Bacillus sp. es.034 TaxID=1761763 RepID=UPI0025703731|nr:hypothetical protein [Bacillus sp. es.034]